MVVAKVKTGKFKVDGFIETQVNPVLKEARKFMESSKEMGVRVLGKIGKVTYMAEFIRDQSCYITGR